MAYLLKLPMGLSKGIIIFTHKERAFFGSEDEALRKVFLELRARYFLGMHWGHFHADVGPIESIDFHLAGPGTLQLRPDVETPVIPLCSRNFLPAFFSPQDEPKFWDIINVSRPLQLKYLDQFMAVIRQLYDLGKTYRVLLICAVPSDFESADGWYSALYEDYLRLFSQEERGCFTLMILREGYPFCLPKETMAFFYRASKVFTLFSQKEGESRVIAEALLCGLPVVVRRTLLGGGRDFLDDTNSRQFDGLDEAASCFIDLLDHYRNPMFDLEPMSEALCETRTVPRLLAYLKQLYDKHGLPFEGQIDVSDLDRALPSHLARLPKEWRSPATDDLNSREAVRQFVTAVLALNPG